MSFSMSRDEFAAYLDSVRITGEVATPRENNLDHIQGFLDGNEHLEFGVQWTREWDYDSVFEVMVRRAGLNPDRSHTHGQDTIGAEQCISALEEYARIFGPPGDRSQTGCGNRHAPPRRRYGRTPPGR